MLRSHHVFAVLLRLALFEELKLGDSPRTLIWSSLLSNWSVRRADDESIMDDRIEDNFFSWQKDSLVSIVNDWFGLLQGLPIGRIGKGNLGLYSFPIAQDMHFNMLLSLLLLLYFSSPVYCLLFGLISFDLNLKFLFYHRAIMLINLLQLLHAHII